MPLGVCPAYRGIIDRRIERREIFLNRVDRKDFISRLARLAEDSSMAVYARALFPNHFHLLCKAKKRPLSSCMRKLLTSYGVNFNKRHNGHGHLFENRYPSIVCQGDPYLLELVQLHSFECNQSGIGKGHWGTEPISMVSSFGVDGIWQEGLAG
jgi:REP element-mobilizing transposase RayT